MFRIEQVQIEQEYHLLCSPACILYFLLSGEVCISQLHYLRSIDRKPQGLCAVVDQGARGLSSVQVPDKLFAQGALI